MKIAFIAPSSYGKSTAVGIIQKHFNSKNIKIAKPLYDLQKYFYQYIGKQIGDTQDGELLQFLGVKIRKENPIFLLDNFYQNVMSSQNEIPCDYEINNFGTLKEYELEIIMLLFKIKNERMLKKCKTVI